MKRSVWWFLAMEFHLDANTGHGTGKARDCWECQRIAKLVERFTAERESALLEKVEQLCRERDEARASLERLYLLAQKLDPGPGDPEEDVR